MKRNTKKTLSQDVATTPHHEGLSAAHLPWEDSGLRGSPSAEDLEHTSDTAEEPAGEDDTGPDDALGLYLRQMGAIPLLNRKEEEILAKKLERQRQRYRHAALCNWRTLDLVVQTFQRVRAGKQALDPTIDVVTTLGLTREKILERMPQNLPPLRPVL